MSSLPRSTGSFKRLRAVRSLVSQLFRRRRRKFVKKFAIPSITISSSPPVSGKYSAMSLILHCRHLAPNTTGDDSAVSSPVSSIEDMFAADVFRESDDEG
ncbi:hypothetical protein RvY_09736 [Ramazzottius varieornatus]|uniref:Uncharacterized protein n=1 Tax=Ramazzottius varieornatus TaxID=947166 RepID=A0A1D1VEV0_RAMVA|nr:hypothetical protein RvY_09736 [Ramazzottius varieornatus]